MDKNESYRILKNPNKAGRESIIYSSIYELSRDYYRREKFKNVLRLIYRIFLIILIIVSISGIIFYSTSVKPYINSLKNKINIYENRLVRLNDSIESMKLRESSYINQLQEYRSFLSHVKIEDNRIIDYDLSEIVNENNKKLDGVSIHFVNFSRGNVNIPETALTFDLGNGRELPYVYKTLKNFHVPATIFLTNANPSLEYGSLLNDKNIHYLQKLSEIGCEFGNHTWSHFNLLSSLYETSKKRRLSLLPVSDKVIDELSFTMEFKRVFDIFYQKTGLKLSPIWRAPYGAIDERVLKLAAKAGYPYHIFWSSNKLGPLDFYDYIRKRNIIKKDKTTGKLVRVKNPYYFSSSEMLQRLELWEKTDSHGLNGAISIAHLGTARKFDKIISILPDYIAFVKKRGYRFVTVSKLIDDSKL